ncbi:hypothetical protein [Metabacillus fastidiosus]|uniref:hypothetical protein n=1 Tax=Metabacillus fastidiosus TaxID=1458 RepID=UPI003D2C100E
MSIKLSQQEIGNIALDLKFVMVYQGEVKFDDLTEDEKLKYDKWKQQNEEKKLYFGQGEQI